MSSSSQSIPSSHYILAHSVKVSAGLPSLTESLSKQSVLRESQKDALCMWQTISSGHYDHAKPMKLYYQQTKVTNKRVQEGNLRIHKMDPLSSNADPFSDEAAQKDVSEWLRTTDVLDQDFKRSRSSDEATLSSSARRPNKFRRQSSLDYVLSDEEMVGISISTFLRGAAGQLGVEVESTDFDNTHNSSTSQLSTSHQPVNGLKATKPASMIDLTTDDAVSQPSTSAHVSISSTSPHYDHQDKGVNSDQIQSSVASTGTGARALPDLRSSRDFICNRQKMSHQYPRQISESLLEPIPINNWRKMSHQDSQMTDAPEPSHGSSSPNSFFRNMNEHSSQFLRMMSISSATPHGGVSTNSMSGSAIMSDASSYNELEGAMAQTRQSRQMIMGAFSGIARNDSNTDSSATAAATAGNMPKFGNQNGQIDMVDPAQRLPASSDVNRTSPGLSAAEAKRSLEQIAKEQMILEKRLAQLQREGFSR